MSYFNFWSPSAETSAGLDVSSVPVVPVEIATCNININIIDELKNFQKNGKLRKVTKLEASVITKNNKIWEELLEKRMKIMSKSIMEKLEIENGLTQHTPNLAPITLGELSDKMDKLMSSFDKINDKLDKISHGGKCPHCSR